MQRIKRIVVTVVGGTVRAVGIASIVLPGPTFTFISVSPKGDENRKISIETPRL